MTHMDTDGGPQADFVGELLLTNDEGLFASSSSCASSSHILYFQRCSSSCASFWLLINDRGGEMFGGLELFE